MVVQQIQPKIVQNTLGQVNPSPALNNMQNRIQPAVPLQDMTTEKIEKPKKLTDIFERITNPPDMEDTVEVPRTIFKGYLSFAVGTSLLTLSPLVKKTKPLSTGLTILGTLATIYGTYAFVKPYILKERKSV